MRYAIAATVALFAVVLCVGLSVEFQSTADQPAIVVPSNLMAAASTSDLKMPSITLVAGQEAAPPVEQVYGRQAGAMNDGYGPTGRLQQLELENDRLIDRYNAREAAWSNWFRSLDRYVQSRGLPPLKRIGQSRGTGAMNTGIYGEGRPSTGEYGRSRPVFGNVKVDCPECQLNNW